MQCLYCGKSLGALRELKDSDFCSDTHRKRYHERIKRGFSQLLETAEPPTKAKPEDRHRPVVVLETATEPEPALVARFFAEELAAAAANITHRGASEPVLAPTALLFPIALGRSVAPGAFGPAPPPVCLSPAAADSPPSRLEKPTSVALRTESKLCMPPPASSPAPSGPLPVAEPVSMPLGRNGVGNLQHRPGTLEWQPLDSLRGVAHSLAGSLGRPIPSAPYKAGTNGTTFHLPPVTTRQVVFVESPEPVTRPAALFPDQSMAATPENEIVQQDLQPVSWLRVTVSAPIPSAEYATGLRPAGLLPSSVSASTYGDARFDLNAEPVEFVVSRSVISKMPGPSVGPGIAPAVADELATVAASSVVQSELAPSPVAFVASTTLASWRPALETGIGQVVSLPKEPTATEQPVNIQNTLVPEPLTFNGSPVPASLPITPVAASSSAPVVPFTQLLTLKATASDEQAHESTLLPQWRETYCVVPAIDVSACQLQAAGFLTVPGAPAVQCEQPTGVSLTTAPLRWPPTSITQVPTHIRPAGSGSGELRHARLERPSPEEHAAGPRCWLGMLRIHRPVRIPQPVLCTVRDSAVPRRSAWRGALDICRSAPLYGKAMAASAVLTAVMVWAAWRSNALDAPLAAIHQMIQARGTIELGDDFHGGMGDFEGGGNWVDSWSFSADGFMRTGQLALYRPSLTLSDYRLEFFGQIERQSMGWVLRAANPRNYYAVKVTIVDPGPRPLVKIIRYSVIEGQQSAPVEVPVRLMLHNNTPYHVQADVTGNHFATSLEGQLVDTWSDDHLKVGGVGFFSGEGERARLYWIKLTSNTDLLGKLCASLAPNNLRTRK